MKKLLSFLFLFVCAVACIFIVNNRTFAADGPVITVQPEDADVSYPDGATFHVEVEDPDNVASYQWQMSDGGSLFMLDGVTASTDTLVVPSVEQDFPMLFFSCIITDKDGNTVESDPAVLTINNQDEDKTVLTVGGYAVEPGESLDLSETMVGSGLVTFDADGATITFDNVHLDTTNVPFDHALGDEVGLYLFRRHSEVLEYHLNFLGECSILNSYYDPDYNSGGVTINAYFGSGDDENHPVIIIGGDGLLTVTGGGNYIYTDANIEVAADMILQPYGDFFADGITCNTLLIGEGVNLEIRANGTAIHADGDIRMLEGSRADLYSSPSRVSVGPTAKNAIFLLGSLYAQGAEMNITGYADPDRFIPYERFLAMLGGIAMNGEIGSINLDHSRLNIDMSMGESQEQYAANFSAIVGAEIGNALSLVNDSSVKVSIQTPDSIGATGIQIGGLVTVEDGSEIILDINGSGETFGLIAERALTVNDSAVDSKVVSSDGGPTYGIVCGEAEITLNDSLYSVHSVAEGGIALAADTGEVIDDLIDFVPDYTSTEITLGGSARIAAPKHAIFSLQAVPGYGAYIRAETIFDPADTTKAAQEVLIDAPVSVLPYIISMGAVLILIVAAVLAWFKSTKKTEKPEEEGNDNE